MTTGTDSTTAAGYRVLNPATGEVVERFDTATDDEVRQALTAADQAFDSWRKKPMRERAAFVTRVAELFTERADELARTITEEMGKPRSQATGEAEFCTDIFNYYADNGEELAADKEIKTLSGGRAVIQRRPVGVLLGIMPWNYPYYQVARFAAPNLVLGNTIILKHAESCPRSALAIQQIMDDAGVPEGVYTNLFASHEQIATIIADPRVQGVSLTGSERAGAVIGQLAGKNLKKAVLELGGSDPYVVLDADDVKAAAATAWATRMENTGQACNSNKRIIVSERIHDEFVAELTELARGLRPGDPAGGGGHVRAVVLAGCRRAARRAGQGRRCQGRHPARGRRARRRTGRLLRAGGAHRHHARDARLHRGALRSGRGRLPGQR